MPCGTRERAVEIAALVGANVDLLGKPKLENRNWTLTPAGYEPIVPFELRIDGVGADDSGARPRST